MKWPFAALPMVLDLVVALVAITDRLPTPTSGQEVPRCL